MTQTAGTDRPFRPEDITGQVVVNIRGPFVEVVQAPDIATIPAGHIFQLAAAGMARLTTVNGHPHLIVGYAYPISTNGRAVYRLTADPRRAVALGGYTTTIEGTRVA